MRTGQRWLAGTLGLLVMACTAPAPVADADADLPDATTPADVTADAATDAAPPAADVPVDSAADAPPPADPLLAIVPPVLDFGTLTIGDAPTKQLKILNKGGKDLHVQAITTDNSPQFFDAELQIQPPHPVVAPGGAQLISLTFAPTVASPGVGQIGTLTVQSDGGTAHVTVLASVAVPTAVSPTALCDLALAPTMLEFGVMQPGDTKMLSLEVHNAGQGACSFKQFNVLSCFQPPSGLGATPQVCTAQPSAEYKAGPVSPQLFNLAADATASVQVQYTAPTFGAFSGQLGKQLLDVGGLAVLTFMDAQGNTVRVPNFAYDFKAISQQPPNLHAQLAQAMLNVQADLDFGWVAMTCLPVVGSPLIKPVDVTDGGALPSLVTQIALADCPTAVQLDNPPVIPLAGLPPPLSFFVTYAPAPAAPLGKCRLRVVSGTHGTCVNASGVPMGNLCASSAQCAPGQLCVGDAVELPMLATLTATTAQTAVLQGWQGPAVDVLFVVDQSPNMAAALQLLFNGVWPLLAGLGGVNYHLGLVVADLQQGGQLVAFNGSAWIEPPAPATATVANFLAKTGSGAVTHDAIDALLAAIAPPLTDSTTVPCGVGTCSNGLVCGGAAFNYTCGGANRGFLRQGTDLEIVIVSAGLDTTVNSAAAIAQAIGQIKANFGGGGIHVNAIVAPVGGCSGSGVTAVADPVVGDLAQATGGAMYSICDGDYGTLLGGLGANATPVQPYYDVLALPPGLPLTVRVDGKLCPPLASNWFVESATASLVFPFTSSCLPSAAATVTATFDPGCP